MTPKNYWDKMCRTIAGRNPETGNSRPRLHCIPEEVYGELATQLVEQIGAANYISNIRIQVETRTFDYEFEVSAVIYWRDIAAPDGNYKELGDVVPIWWELHSYEGDDRVEILNDATFDRIKEHIIAL